MIVLDSALLYVHRVLSNKMRPSPLSALYVSKPWASERSTAFISSVRLSNGVFAAEVLQLAMVAHASYGRHLLVFSYCPSVSSLS